MQIASTPRSYTLGSLLHPADSFTYVVSAVGGATRASPATSGPNTSDNTEPQLPVLRSDVQLDAS